MKNIYKFLGAAALGCFALTSCNNDEFLDVPVYDRVPGDFMFKDADGIKNGMIAIYKMNNPNGETAENWGFKPNLFSGTHPTMDTQAGGWDADFTRQAWNSTKTELNEGWRHAYHGITRCNLYLEGLKDVNFEPALVKTLTAEARCMRAFFYTYLAQTWGRVPMLNTGESYLTHPQKEQAQTYDEMWDFIIEDLKAAAEDLDWQPRDGKRGFATKGMALAYLGDAYMWKAYRVKSSSKEYLSPEVYDNAEKISKECYAEAKKVLKSIIDSGTYKLQSNFATNWDCEGVWNDETIWVEVLDVYDWSAWDDDTSRSMTKWFTASTANGGWGSLYLSWEWYASYEFGDKRRDASCVTGQLSVDDLAKLYTHANQENIAVLEAAKSLDEAARDIDNPDKQARFAAVEKLNDAIKAYNHGVHPYLQEPVGEYDNTSHFHYGAEYMPTIWSSKFWRNASANNDRNCWGYALWSPTSIYWKRYSNVLLDYAECCFEVDGENSTEGWATLDQLRERAFGNLEVAEAASENSDRSRYIGHIKKVVDHFMENSSDFIYTFGINGAKGVTGYPIPWNTETVKVKSAKDYYTAYAACNIKGNAFKSPAWKVAVNEERRKEFSCEWSLRPDMQKSMYLEDHIATTYPIDRTSGDDLVNYPWTFREYEYNDLKNDMPIPADELKNNSLCKQNPAYLNE